MKDRWTALITTGITSALTAVSGALLSTPWLFWPSVAATSLVGVVTCATLLLGQLTGLVENATAFLEAVQRLKDHRRHPPRNSVLDDEPEGDEPGLEGREP
ncbi:hypothetical protein [Streptomyces sp. NPDC001665]